MKKIKLTKGKFALVSDRDFVWLNKFEWRASKKKDYFIAAIKGTGTTMHRFITNCPKGMVVDHKNHNTLDNRRSNLRVCTNAENCRNKGVSKVNKSGYKGVHWYKAMNKWRAVIKKDGKFFFLGFFSSKKEAALAYNRAAKELFKQFAWLNKI